jgi:hypothetical protein
MLNGIAHRLNGLGNRTAVFWIDLVGADTELTMYADARVGKPWTESDLDDLQCSIEAGQSIAATASFLSREGTVGDVVKTAEAHGWYFAELTSDARASLRDGK